MRHRKSPDDDLLEQLKAWLDEASDPYDRDENGYDVENTLEHTLFLTCMRQRAPNGDKLYTLHLLGDQIFKEPKTAIDLKLALGLYGRPVIPVVGRNESGYSDFALVLTTVQDAEGRCIVVL